MKLSHLFAAGMLLATVSIAVADADLTDDASAAKAVDELRKQQQDTLQAEPAKGAAVFDKFMRDHPKMESNMYTQVGTTAIYYYGRVKDWQKILDLAELGMTQMKQRNYPTSAQFFIHKLEALNNLNRPAEAEKLVKDSWQEIVNNPGYSGGIFRQYISSLEKQNKLDAAITEMQKLMFQTPRFLQDDAQGDEGWMYKQLIADMLAQGRDDEALSWAKLRFMECRFNEAAITRASDQLMRTWTAVNLNQAAAQAFMEAQKDPAKINPLADVKPPAIDAETRKLMLGASQGANASAQERVSVYIALSMLGEAMGAARQALVEDAGAAGGAQEVCRVFKATDYNLARANAFVQYFQAGKGTNPLVEFMKQHPRTAPAG